MRTIHPYYWLLNTGCWLLNTNHAPPEYAIIHTYCTQQGVQGQKHMTLSELESAKVGSLAEIAAAADAAAVEALRVKYVGRNGSIPALIKAMKDVPKEDRPAFGKAVQAWRQQNKTEN